MYTYLYNVIAVRKKLQLDRIYCKKNKNKIPRYYTIFVLKYTSIIVLYYYIVTDGIYDSI